MFPTENGYRDRIEDRFDAQEQRCFHGVDFFDPDGKQDIGETVLEHGKDQQPDDIVHVKDQGIGEQERQAHKKADPVADDRTILRVAVIPPIRMICAA